MPVKFNTLVAKPAKMGEPTKTIIRVDDDPIEIEQPPRDEQPLPLDQRFRLDACIRAKRVEMVAINKIQPNPKNAKRHSARQIALLQENFEQFGFTTPLLIDEDDKIIAGHGRYLAAQRAGLEHLPVIRLSHLTAAQKRALAVADNKLAELGEWDLDILAEELSFLSDADVALDFDPRIIGFETVEVDQILGDQPKPDRTDPADDIPVPDPQAAVVTTPGDVWMCGEHRSLCGDATQAESYATLMRGDKADMVFTDHPYNVSNAGHVTKREDVREFAMARGEMSPEEFTAFLSASLVNIFNYMTSGAVAFLCMDWRHLSELWAAARPIFGAPKNLIVWVKRNAGLGSFYRSQHETITVYAASGKPINNFGLDGKGRHRTNVWEYPGFNGFVRGREDKPVAMVMDALKDCSNRGSIILDPFAGSGTTMIAAERTKRRARLMEIDPLYCDTIVQRWQKFTGKAARLAESNETFDEVKARRVRVGRVK